MNARELRIGNFVETNGILWEVGTHDFGLVYRPDFEPIELTEEWLNKFGFKKLDENKKFSTFEIQSTYFDLQVYLPGNYFGVVAGRDEIALNYNLKYVHQLQNLYFALTGEELIII